MRIHRSIVGGFVVGIAALVVSSCAYDPYYSGASYSSGGGYGSGYGYGGSSFSTSFFVSTGSPRWGYDPYAGAYYDYNRRCYYDPYLYGYYPVGYRPRYVYGSPHPHGWRSGRGFIAPPATIRSYNLTNYENRTSRYQSLGRDWSRNVRTAPEGRDQRSGFDGRDSDQGGFLGRGRNREDFRPSPDRRSRGNGAPFGGGNTSVAVPQVPVERGAGNNRRGRFSSDSEQRQAFSVRANEALQQGGNRGRRQMAPPQAPLEPQFQLQPEPQPQQDFQPQAPQNDYGRRGRGAGGETPAGDGGGRGRGVRGLGEG